MERVPHLRLLWLGGLLLLLVVAALSSFPSVLSYLEAREVSRNVDELEDVMENEGTYLTEAWWTEGVSGSLVCVEVRTCKEPDETAEQHRARHDTAVADALQANPFHSAKE